MADLPPDIAALGFEDALAELDRIVRQLEEGRGKLLCDLEEYAFAGRSLAPPNIPTHSG